MKRFQAAMSISAVLLAGCGPQHDGSGIVARVGDVVLTEVELADQLPDQLDEELAAVERSQFIEDWVRQELIFREALDLKVHEKAHVHRLIEQARRDLVVASFLDSVLANRPVDVSDEALTEYYRANQTDFLRTGAETRAQHILLASRGDADALRKKLLEGDSFEKAAEELLSRPGNQNGRGRSRVLHRRRPAGAVGDLPEPVPGNAFEPRPCRARVPPRPRPRARAGRERDGAGTGSLRESSKGSFSKSTGAASKSWSKR